MKSAFLSCFTFTLFLFGVYSVTLNVLQGLNGLLCFSSLENKLVLKDKSVSQIVTSGFEGNDGEFSNYINPIGWHCNDDISELNLRRLNCNNSRIGGNSTTVCSFFDNKTFVQYKVYCDKMEPKTEQLFQFSVNPNGVNLIPDTRSYQNLQGHNGTWVEIEVKTKICSLNRKFYILFISSFSLLSAISLSLIFVLNLSFEMKGLLSRNMSFLEQYLINQGFLTHCNPFGKSILINEVGEKSWLILKKSELTSNLQRWTKINKNNLDISEDLEFNGISQNYLIKHIGNGVSKIIHNDNQGHFEYVRSLSRRKLKFLYIYTILKINKENIDVNGHYPNLEDILKFKDEFLFVKGRVNDRVAGIKVSSAMIELRTNRSDLILHFNNFWGHFCPGVFSKVIKGNRANPDKTIYKNTSWKLYLSDIYKHMALKGNYKIKTFGKSSVLSKINSMEENEIISSEINVSSKEFMESIDEDEDHSEKLMIKEAKQGEVEKEKETLQETLSGLDYIYRKQPKHKPHEIILKFKNKEEQDEELKSLVNFNKMTCSYTTDEELNSTKEHLIGNSEGLKLLNLHMEKNEGKEKKSVTEKRKQKINSLERLIKEGREELEKQENCLKSMVKYMLRVEPCVYDQVIDFYLEKPKKICEINFIFRNEEESSNKEGKEKTTESAKITTESKIDENRITKIHSGFKTIMRENIRKNLYFKVSDKVIEQYLREFEDADKEFIKELIKCCAEGYRPGVKEFHIRSPGGKLKYFSRAAKHLKGLKTIYRACINRDRRRGKKIRDLSKKKKGSDGLKKFLFDLNSEIDNLSGKIKGRAGKSQIEVFENNDPRTIVNKKFNLLKGEMYTFYWISMVYIRKFFVQETPTGEKEINREKYYEACKESIELFIDEDYTEIVKEKLVRLFNRPE